MEDFQALQIAINSITGVLVPSNEAERILKAYDLIKKSPDSTTIKELKDLGCACYGSNSIHKCLCKQQEQ